MHFFAPISSPDTIGSLYPRRKLQLFPQVFHGSQLLWLPVYFPALQTPSEIESALKEKMGANSSLWE